MPKASATIICKMDGCDDGVVGRGFCNKHYIQQRKGNLSFGGQWLQEIKERGPRAGRYPKNARCKIVECKRRPRGHGLCTVHYDEYRRGILDKDGMVLRPKRAARDSYINNNGYRLIRVHEDKKGSSAYELEHRWVMAKVVGRGLKLGEVVHHIDGDKLNNSPSNLELLTISEHPPAHEWTPEMVLQALEALRHNDPSGYHMVMSEQEGLTPEREN